MLLQSEKFLVQGINIFDLKTPENIICPYQAHMVNCDMQDLSMQRDQFKADGMGRRRDGVKCLPIWALTMKQLGLALSKLHKGGILNFRFGWRGFDLEKTWYQDCAVILLIFFI